MDEALEWETLDTEIAYSCPGFDVVSETVRLPDGTVTDFDYLSEPPAVVVLPFTDTEEVVVIEEWREPVDRVNWGLPVGTVENEDDDLVAAAKRELREETGYEATSVEHLTTVEPSNGVADSIHHYFVARGCAPTAEQDLDADEQIRVSTTTFEEFWEDALGGDLRDGRAVLAACYYSSSRSHFS